MTAVPVLPAGAGDVPVRVLHVPPPQKKLKPKAAAPALALEADHLPKLAPYSLPPRLVLRARVHAPAGKRALERRVLHSSHLALSPSALKAVRGHRVSPGALALLLHTPRLGAPLLVFSAKGRSLEVQATRMWMTRSTLVALGQAADAGTARLAAPATGDEWIDRRARTARRDARPAGRRHRQALSRHPVRLGRRQPDRRLRLLRADDVRLQAARHHARSLRSLAVPRGHAHRDAEPAAGRPRLLGAARPMAPGTSACTSATAR